jgi:hypothetical protein
LLVFGREGTLERDEENSDLNLKEGDEGALQQVLGCSISYRIAIGPQQGRKVFTLQTIPFWGDNDCFSQVAKEPGFSLHAGVVAQALGCGRSWKGRADIFQDQGYQRSGSPSHHQAISVTSSK